MGVGPGDEVLLPPLSFVATANAVAHLGAVPHFVDEQDTIGLCPVALATRLEACREREGCLVNRETGRRIVAVLPVHVFSHPAPVDQLGQWQIFGACPLLKMLLKPLPLVGKSIVVYLVLLGYLVSMETS